LDLLDLVIVAVALMAAVGGYRLGFLGRVTSWLLLAVGFYVAIRIVPTVIRHLGNQSPGVLVTVAVLILVGGALIGQAVGLVLGARLHRALPFGPWRQVDKVVGAVAGAVGVIVVLWLLIPAVAAVPGWAAQETARSGIARWVSRDLPVPPNSVQELRRFITDAPQVFAVLQPGTSGGPPPSASPLTPALTAQVVASTVKVEGQACSDILEGSGFAVAPDLVVTNAHVVAGEAPGATTVLLPSGRQLRATVVMFDPSIDLALLEVPSLGENPLPVATAHTGTTGAVFGHPNGQDPVAINPASVVLIEEAVGRDLYDQHTTKRNILVLAADLAHGDSGGPLVTTDGAVIGVVFAISADSSTTAYALNSTELETGLAEPRNPNGTSTGSCLTS
jgi:uncharacterized membrane protein required for colicin V production